MRMRSFYEGIGAALASLLGLALTLWLIFALFNSGPTGHYYVDTDRDYKSVTYEEVQYGFDRVYYEGDEDRALDILFELRSRQTGGDIIRP